MHVGYDIDISMAIEIHNGRAGLAKAIQAAIFGCMSAATIITNIVGRNRISNPHSGNLLLLLFFTIQFSALIKIICFR